jgi:hypothetical protein
VPLEMQIFFLFLLFNVSSLRTLFRSKIKFSSKSIQCVPLIIFENTFFSQSIQDCFQNDQKKASIEILNYIQTLELSLVELDLSSVPPFIQCLLKLNSYNGYKNNHEINAAIEKLILKALIKISISIQPENCNICSTYLIALLKLIVKDSNLKWHSFPEYFRSTILYNIEKSVFNIKSFDIITDCLWCLGKLSLDFSKDYKENVDFIDFSKESFFLSLIEFLESRKDIESNIGKLLYSLSLLKLNWRFLSSFQIQNNLSNAFIKHSEKLSDLEFINSIYALAKLNANFMKLSKEFRYSILDGIERVATNADNFGIANIVW